VATHLNQYYKHWQEEDKSVQRRKYDPDFNRNAVQLTDEPDRSVVNVADNLGIFKDLLYN